MSHSALFVGTFEDLLSRQSMALIFDTTLVFKFHNYQSVRNGITITLMEEDELFPDIDYKIGVR